MGRGRRGPAERVEPGCGSRDTVCSRKVRFLSHRTTGGRKIAGGDGRAIGVEKYLTRAIRAKRFDRIRCPTGKRPTVGGGDVHRRDAKGIDGRSVTRGLAGGGNGQAATMGVQMQKAARATTQDNHQLVARVNKRSRIDDFEGILRPVLGSGGESEHGRQGGVQQVQIVVVCRSTNWVGPLQRDERGWIYRDGVGIGATEVVRCDALRSKRWGRRWGRNPPARLPQCHR